MIISGRLENLYPKQTIAAIGGWVALVGFLLITTSGILQNRAVFYTGVVFLGIGTGVSTISNLSLMLDMTVDGQVGLFIGSWGMANAISRLIGSVLGGAGRDILVRTTGNVLLGYIIVFGIISI